MPDNIRLDVQRHQSPMLTQTPPNRILQPKPQTIPIIIKPNNKNNAIINRIPKKPSRKLIPSLPDQHNIST